MQGSKKGKGIKGVCKLCFIDNSLVTYLNTVFSIIIVFSSRGKLWSPSKLFHSLDIWHKSIKLTAKIFAVSV